jgi:Ser/Thr protein kinase RdoA (MazF antagonist)
MINSSSIFNYNHPMHPHLLSQACSLYNTTPDQLAPLSGGHYNAVFQFPIPQTCQVLETWQATNEYAILRIGVKDCPSEQTLGMLEWVNFLAKQGAPVSAPLRSINGHLLEQLEFDGRGYVITSFKKAEGTLAENIPPSEWTPQLYRSIGKAVGKFHRISTGYMPSSRPLTRLQWQDSYEVHEATLKLAHTSDPAGQKLANLLDELQQLPSSPADFGLIHDDLHFANFLVHPDGNITIIDFDDCQYGWFAMDIAMALFDVLVLYNAPTDAESTKFANQFLSNYLSGYRQEKDITQFWLSQVPKFLKLKELCIYADLLGHPDVSQTGSWVGRFMRNRAERIANDIPYVQLDFTGL